MATITTAGASAPVSVARPAPVDIDALGLDNILGSAERSTPEAVALAHNARTAMNAGRVVEAWDQGERAYNSFQDAQRELTEARTRLQGTGLPMNDPRVAGLWDRYNTAYSAYKTATIAFNADFQHSTLPGENVGRVSGMTAMGVVATIANNIVEVGPYIKQYAAEAIATAKGGNRTATYQALARLNSVYQQQLSDYQSLQQYRAKVASSSDPQAKLLLTQIDQELAAVRPGLAESKKLVAQAAGYGDSQAASWDAYRAASAGYRDAQSAVRLINQIDYLDRWGIGGSWRDNLVASLRNLVNTTAESLRPLDDIAGANPNNAYVKSLKGWGDRVNSYLNSELMRLDPPRYQNWDLDRYMVPGATTAA